MPRRGNVPKREILPDPMYNSVLVTKLINSVMLDGKKGVAQKVVYDAFDIIKEKTGKEPLDAFTEAMNNIMPSLEVKARRVGGATYQVPMEDSAILCVSSRFFTAAPVLLQASMISPARRSFMVFSLRLRA